MIYISNAQIVKTSKLIKNINLSSIKEYNLVEVFVDLKNLDNTKNYFQAELTQIK